MSRLTRCMWMAFGAAAALCASLAYARDFRSADVHPADYPTVMAVQYMGKQLAAETQGLLGVRGYPSGVLGSERGKIEQLRLGGPAMMRNNAGPLNGVVPEPHHTRVPFVFRSPAHIS